MKNVVITGSVKGIGKATALYFIEKGWNVIGIDCVTMPDDELSQNRNYSFLALDLSSHLDLQSIPKLLEEKGINRLDCLVNNAAKQICKSFEDVSEADWDMVMNVNIRAPFFLSQICLPYFSKGGTIVNISSVHSRQTSESMSVYATSKGALETLTRSLAIDLASKQIRVNCVLPGAVDTEMLKEGMKRESSGTITPEDRFKLFEEKHLVGRVGKPVEIAAMIYFLGSNLSEYVTGQSFIIDGGALSKLSTE